MRPKEKGPRLVAQPQAPFKDASPAQKKLSRRTAKRRKNQARHDRGTPQTRRHRDAARLNSGEDRPGYRGPITSLRFQDPPKNNYGSGNSSLRGVSMSRLVNNGTITSKEENAAHQIVSKCRDIEDECRIQSSALERVDYGTDTDALARWLDSRATHWSVFIAWKKSLKTIHPDAFRIIVNIVVFGHQLKSIDRRYHHDDGFAKDILVKGLRRWIEIREENEKNIS